MSEVDQNIHCHTDATGIDWFFWICFSLVSVFFLFGHFEFFVNSSLVQFSTSVNELIIQMWWGLALGFFFVGLLSHIPRNWIISLFGRRNDWRGLLRATFAGLVLDLCSHGILLIGAKLYERGVTLGQLMAFLIASPWNSLSLTVILVSLVGLEWTIVFVVFSALIALFSGAVFEHLERKGVLPQNPNRQTTSAEITGWREIIEKLRGLLFQPENWKKIFVSGLKEGRTIARWLFFGVLLASAIRTWISSDDLQTWVGPSLVGLMMTLIFATVIEVCSEGLAPVAAEIVNRAAAPGNGFAFLMTGVATDYTEIMVIRQATGSWKIALFLPLVTVPQVLLIGYWMNGWSMVG